MAFTFKLELQQCCCCISTQTLVCQEAHGLGKFILTKSKGHLHEQITIWHVFTPHNTTKLLESFMLPPASQHH